MSHARMVNVAGPSDLYEPDLSREVDEIEGLGQWLEAAGAVVSVFNKKRQQRQAAAADKEMAAKLKRKADKEKARLAAVGHDAPGAPAAAGFGWLPLLLIGGVLVGGLVMSRRKRGRR